MLRYTIKRLLLMIPVIIGITLTIYVVLELSPRDPVVAALGESAEYTIEQYEAMKVQMGLDGPLVIRYLRYMSHAVRGDLGDSWFNNYNVTAEFGHRLPYSLKIGIYANIVSILLGIPLGIIAAVRYNKEMDLILTFFAMLLVSAPGFWVGMLAQQYVSIYLGLLPVSGAATFAHYVLPSTVLATSETATNMRITRTWLIDVIRSDYVRTARAKGAGEVRVLVRHALRNALLPVITTLGAHFAFIIGGVAIIETVFAIPGIGSFLVNGVRTGDAPVVMGCVIVIALFVGMVNLLVDLLYAVVDPRVKYS